MNESLLLQAFQGKNRTVPVWFMRQAGRFLPEYRALKKDRNLEEMFRTPELASKITLLPVDLLHVDAAILFADILTLPSAMGFDIVFIDGKGPVIGNPIVGPEDVRRIHDMEDVDYVRKTIKLVNQSLPADVPLIGFAGAPFTVATYLIKVHNALGFSTAARFAIEHPVEFHELMAKITANTIRYLNLQKKAGIKVFQLFDTWGGVLRGEDYKNYVLPYIKEIFKSVDLPSIYYLKNCSHLLKQMESCGADFLSVCETVRIGENELLNRTRKGVQGNLYNGFLYADEKTLRAQVRQILTAARTYHKKYIFNLNHGIFPDVPVEKVKIVIDEVKRFKWRE
jgi:uroporphyrinogen decarboxylase